MFVRFEDGEGSLNLHFLDCKVTFALGCMLQWQVLRRAGWLILDVETVLLQAHGVSFALILFVNF